MSNKKKEKKKRKEIVVNVLISRENKYFRIFNLELELSSSEK